LTVTRNHSGEARPLLIFPCNGNGTEALDCIGNQHRFIGFVDDDPGKQVRGAFGHRVDTRSALTEHRHAGVLAVPGSPTSYHSRRGLIESLGVTADRYVQVIDPSARISPRATIGRNVLIMAGVVVTSNAVVGDHVCILPNTVVHHDSVVGEWALVGANVTIAGGVVIGSNSYVGSGTSVMNGIRIGERALVGLGSNVIRDVADGATVAGNPAWRLH
jgi:sugar O-acyltransferase (sialic acid O-acetyltransferase NeuD family)